MPYRRDCFLFIYKAGRPQHTPYHRIAEFNMGAYEYALTRQRVATATYVKFGD